MTSMWIHHSKVPCLNQVYTSSDPVRTIDMNTNLVDWFNQPIIGFFWSDFY